MANYDINTIREFDAMDSKAQAKFMADNPDFLDFLTTRSMGSQTAYKRMDELTPEQQETRREQTRNQGKRQRQRAQYALAFMDWVNDQNPKVGAQAGDALAAKGIYWPSGGSNTVAVEGRAA